MRCEVNNLQMQMDYPSAPELLLGQESPSGHGWPPPVSPFSTPGREQTASPAGSTHGLSQHYTHQPYSHVGSHFGFYPFESFVV